MKKKKNNGLNDEVNYWQSSADVLAALLMIILLIMMILLLYLVKMPENDQIDPDVGNESSTVAEDDNDDDWDSHETSSPYDSTENTHEYDYDYDNDDDGGGGGDGDGTNPGIYDGTGPGDGLGKTAVYVNVVDADTLKNILEEGITFELYVYNTLQSNWQLDYLNTYYPVRIEYKTYETTDEGVFYLPEKVYIGKYKFHELTAPYGYDFTDDLEFDIDEGRDWNDPFIVTIPLSPSKNIIRIQVNDTDTKAAVTDGTYYVVASEDIATLDGTVRYKKGEIVDEIEVDENGYGESIELYLGSYELTQHNVQEYYAAHSETIPVEVEKKNGTDVTAPLHEILEQKTAFTINVNDELYSNIHISDASFSVAYNDGTDITDYASTDETGSLTVTNLAKNTTYHVTQISTTEGYIVSSEMLDITVDSDGHIDGEITPVYDISNRIIRTKYSVRDILLRSLVSDMNVTLYSETGEVTGSWDSTALATEINGISSGNYYLLVNGRETTRKNIYVADTAEIQEYSVYVWTNKSILILILLILFLIILVILLIWYLIHFREDRKKHWENRKRRKAQLKEEKKRINEAQKAEREKMKAETQNTKDK